jgi:hypothetical protein
VLPSFPACRQLTSTPGSLSSQFNSRTTPALAALHKRVLMALLHSGCMRHELTKTARGKPQPHYSDQEHLDMDTVACRCLKRSNQSSKRHGHRNRIARNKRAGRRDNSENSHHGELGRGFHDLNSLSIQTQAFDVFWAYLGGPKEAS